MWDMIDERVEENFMEQSHICFGRRSWVDCCFTVQLKLVVIPPMHRTPHTEKRLAIFSYHHSAE
jgi:hypothetical protein